MQYYTSIGYEEISATSATAIGLTAAKITSILPKGQVRIQVSAYPVAFRIDGGVPTGSTIQQLAVGSVLYLDDISEMKNFLSIGVGGTAVLAVDYAVYVGSN